MRAGTVQLHLHIGTEKTGTSFLQSLCALGREELVQEGVWFATGSAYDERCMANGRISAGNARVLAEHIRGQRWREVRARLGRLVADARADGCNTILLSSEWMLAAVVPQGRLAAFTAIVKSLGAPQVRLLLVLRDPVEQFLSLYKHRAKRGTAGSVAEWSLGGYRLPAELAGLRQQLGEAEVQLVARGYRREKGGLERLFFEEWLGVSTPKVDIPEAVNPSLSLSELEVLRMLAERRPSLVTPLYERLAAVDLKEKVQGRDLETFARAIAERGVAAHQEEWVAWNKLLPVREQLVIPQPEGEVPPEPRELGFSKTQMEALMGVLAESVEPRFLGQLLWAGKIRPLLGRARRLVLHGRP